MIHTVTYEDQGRERPVLYRASVADMVVPYGDPRPTYFHRNAFDVGEYGIGTLANALENGCDCLGEIRYLDAVVNDSRGRAVTLPNAICIHEEDAGILWKHVDWRLGSTEVRRSRRLVVSSISTVGNYEYGFYWYFYQDGTIQLEVKLTGIISNGAEPLGVKPPWGELVAPGGVRAHPSALLLRPARHDGRRAGQLGLRGEHRRRCRRARRTRTTTPSAPRRRCSDREGQARRILDPLAGRFWKIVNPSVRNRLGEPVAYKLMPGENVLPFAGPEAAVTRRAGFMTRHLWVTRYDPRERYAAGEYPNQHPGGRGPTELCRDDAPLENTDVVVWYTFGAHHVVRPEDWPVMPVATDRLHAQAGRLLRPEPRARRPAAHGQWGLRPRRLDMPLLVSAGALAAAREAMPLSD